MILRLWTLVAVVILPQIASSQIKDDEIFLNFNAIEPVPINIEVCNLLNELKKHFKINNANYSWLITEEMGNIMNSFFFKFYSDNQDIAYLFHILQNSSLMTSTQLDRDLLCTSDGKRQTNIEEARRKINTIRPKDFSEKRNSFTQVTKFWTSTGFENKSPEDLIYSCSLNFDVAFVQRAVMTLANGEILQNTTPIKIRVQLDIQDVNDNSPRWIPEGRMMLSSGGIHSTNQMTIHFKDGDPPETSHPLPGCVDADAGVNGKISYSIRDLNETNPTTGDVHEVEDFKLTIGQDSGLISLTSKVELDREKRDSYKFLVIAKDGGFPALTSELRFEVKLIDVNDNEPKFDRDIFSPKYPIREDVSVGTKVLQLVATDPDEGVNGQIVFGFSETQSRQHAKMRLARKFFDISTSGLVTVRNRLDVDDPSLAFLETRIRNNIIEKLIKFRVQAKDSAQHPYEKVTEAQISIWILDVNDEGPIIKTHILSHSNLPSVLEGQPIGTVVTNIETAKMIDRDTMPGSVQTLEITCQDMVGHERLEKISIQILDVNDNSPSFFSDLFVMLIDENAQVNTSLMFQDRLHKHFAYDLDTSINAEIEYDILEADGKTNFTINPLTGVIRSKVIFDREKIEDVTFTIIARDRGHPQRTATSKVKVEIVDLNDNKPEFSLDLYTFHISENEEKNSFVGQVEAFDLDSGYFGEFPYTIGERIGSHNSLLPFIVDPKNGRISAQRSLDREEEPEYMFTVIAKDGFGFKPYIENQKLGPYSQNTGSTTVHIIIDDINDNSPEIKAYSLQNGKVLSRHASIDLSINEPRGSQIIQFTVEDKDELINADSQIKIKTGNENGLFTLDQDSGLLIVEKDIKEFVKNKPEAKQHVVTLTVEACDNGIQKLCSHPFDLRIYFKENILLFSETTAESWLTKKLKQNDKHNGQQSRNLRASRSNEVLIIFIIIFSILTIGAFIAFFIVWQRFQKSSNTLYLGRNPQLITTNNETNRGHRILQHPNGQELLPNQYSTMAFGQTINPKKYLQNNSLYHLHTIKGSDPSALFDQIRQPENCVDESKDPKVYHQLVLDNTNNRNNRVYLKNYSVLNNGNCNYESLQNAKFCQSLTRSKSQQINKKFIPIQIENGSMALLQKTNNNNTKSFDELTFSSIEEDSDEQRKLNELKNQQHQTPCNFPETSFV